MVNALAKADVSPVASPLGAIRGGLPGHRMLVVPRPAVEKALRHPVTGKLLVTDAGHFTRAARHECSRPHGAQEHVLMVCTDGSGWCRIGDARFAVARGGVVVLPANQSHSYGAAEDDPWTLWWFHFTGTDAADLVRTAQAAANNRVTHLGDPAPLASLVAQVIDALDSGPTLAAFTQAAGAAWYALAQVIAAGRRSPSTSVSPLERAIEHLRATTPNRTSMATLASMVGLSLSQLGHLFREHLGISPLQFQVQLRMEQARELLDGTDMSIGMVAREAGYDDPMYFSRQFARLHGMTPSKYRRRPAGS